MPKDVALLVKGNICLANESKESQEVAEKVLNRRTTHSFWLNKLNEKFNYLFKKFQLDD